MDSNCYHKHVVHSFLGMVCHCHEGPLQMDSNCYHKHVVHSFLGMVCHCHEGPLQMDSIFHRSWPKAV